MFSRAKALFSIYFIAAVDNCGYAMVFVLFPSLLLDHRYGFMSLHATLAERLLSMGALYAAFPIAQLIGAPVIGEFADRYGRKKIFFLTILGTIIGYFFTGFTLGYRRISLVFVGRFLTGLFSGNQGLCNASIADLSPDEKQRARNFGILTVVWGLSFPIALLLGGVLSDPTVSQSFSPSLPFYIVGCITALSLVTIVLFLPETFQAKEDKQSIDLIKGLHNIVQALKMKTTRAFFCLVLIWTIGWGYSVTWFGAYCIQNFGVSQQVVTFGLLVQGLFWTFGGSVMNPLLLGYTSVRKAALCAYFVAAILLLLSAFMTNFLWFILIYSLSAIMGSVSLSCTFNLISTASPASIQGKTMGLTQSLMSLGFFLVPILGSITGAISIYTFYPVAALFMFLGGSLLFSLEKKEKS